MLVEPSGRCLNAWIPGQARDDGEVARDDRDMAGRRVFMVFVPPYSTPYSRAQLVQKIFSRDSFFRPGNDVKVATASGQRESMCG